jgi:hypothetical protein
MLYKQKPPRLCDRRKLQGRCKKILLHRLAQFLAKDGQLTVRNDAAYQFTRYKMEIKVPRLAKFSEIYRIWD